MVKKQAYHALRGAGFKRVVLDRLERVSGDVFIYLSPYTGSSYLIIDTKSLTDPLRQVQVTKGECNVTPHPK